MKKVNIRVVQIPIEIEFQCPCCEKEFEIDYKEFMEDVAIIDGLGSLMNDRHSFICPKCDEYIEIDEVELD